MFAHLVGDGLCLPLSCVDMSFAAEQLVRALKTHVEPRQADCRHVGIFETQRVSGFFKMVAPGRGAVPKYEPTIHTRF